MIFFSECCFRRKSRQACESIHASNNGSYFVVLRSDCESHVIRRVGRVFPRKHHGPNLRSVFIWNRLARHRLYIISSSVLCILYYHYCILSFLLIFYFILFIEQTHTHKIVCIKEVSSKHAEITLLLATMRSAIFIFCSQRIQTH